MADTFYRPLSRVVELCNRYAGETCAEVETADSCDPQSVTPTTAYL